MTRRVIKPQPPAKDGFASNPFNWNRVEQVGPYFHIMSDEPKGMFTVESPFAGRLWVRETFLNNALDGYPPVWFYRADGEDKPDDRKWKPSIFMPRAASRITLEVLSVRAERLQMITEADAKAEGTPDDALVHYYCDEGDPDDPNDFGTHRCNWRYAFSRLWESINGKRPGCAWDDNPLVWVIEFRKL